MADWYDELPTAEPPSPHWATPEFAAEIEAWCASALGEVRAMENTKLRPWSTVWTVDTPDGRFWAKQNSALFAAEAGLLAALAELVPHHVVPVAAVDPARGMLATPDQGPVLRETAGDDVEVWCRVVAEGAALQRDVAPSVDRLAATGVPRLAAADSLGYLDARVDSLAALPVGDPRVLSAEDAARVRGRRDVVAGWVDEVASLGLPVTLNHNDLHGANVFERDGELWFFDFGDAVLSEPLQALLIPLNVLRHQLECAADDARLARVADAALEVWSDVVPSGALRAALPAALGLGRLGRVESWARVIGAATPAELEEWGDGAAFWLTTLTEDPPYQ